MHGGHLLSGKQTPEGRKRISDAMRKRMLAFWSDWRAAGKPGTALEGPLTYGSRKPACVIASAAEATRPAGGVGGIGPRIRAPRRDEAAEIDR